MSETFNNKIKKIQDQIANASDAQKAVLKKKLARMQARETEVANRPAPRPPTQEELVTRKDQRRSQLKKRIARLQQQLADLDNQN